MLQWAPIKAPFVFNNASYYVHGGREKMLYPIAISKGDAQHAWGVEVPDLPGCFSAGENLDDVMVMAREAIEGHLEILVKDGAPIPPANDVSFHAASPKYEGCTWSTIDVGTNEFNGAPNT